MPTDYKGDKQKPSKMALIISVGPKMPKSPEDTSKPDDKAMKKAWDALKKQQDEPDDFMNYPPNYLKPMDQSPYNPMQQPQTPQPYTQPQQPQNPPLPSPYDMRNPPIEPIPPEDHPDAIANPYRPSDEEINRKIMQMLPPIPPREERRANMMRDGTPHTPGQQSMIDRATEMYRQQKMRGE